jgi:hypothetical protein
MFDTSLTGSGIQAVPECRKYWTRNRASQRLPKSETLDRLPGAKNLWLLACGHIEKEDVLVFLLATYLESVENNFLPN